MGFQPSNSLNAIPEVHTKAEVKSLWLAFGSLQKTVSTLVRNNEAVVAYTPSSITLTAGAGLTGGGDLTANRSFAVGAGTGITVAADSVSISSSYLGANPTGTVGLSVVNGSATTYLRSDGAPALSQAIIPTWTQVHTFSAQDVHNAGVSLGTSGVLASVVADGAATIGYDLNDATTRTTGFARKLRQGSTILETVSWDGRFSFGYNSSLLPQTGHQLAFLSDTVNTPAGSPVYVGILASVNHSDTAETVNNLIGIVGAARAATATGLTAATIHGVSGVVASADIVATGKTLAGVSGRLVYLNSIAIMEPNTGDVSFGKSSQPGGSYDHVTMFWAQNVSFSSTTGYPTNKPAIVSAIRTTIQDWGASTTSGTPAGQYWSVYGEHINGTSASYPAVTGFMRCVYPRRTTGSGGTTRAMHIWFEPWPMSAAGAGAAGAVRPNAAEGDVYFDDNTNFTGGLWEFSGVAGGANAWNYLLSSPGVAALGGGAAPTLGTIGGAGPAAAAQATWIQVNCADNVVRWVPAWV